MHYFLKIFLFFKFIIFSFFHNGVWGLGIGDWGLGIGDWGLGMKKVEILINYYF
jgi:hypothetical protein